MEVKEIDLENLSIQPVESDALEEKKPHVSGAAKTVQDIVGLILKFNPIDPLNKIGRKILNFFDLLDKSDQIFYWCAFPIVRHTCRMLWNMKVEGEMFPEYGGGVVVSNHVSHMDPFFISAAVQRRLRWMSKEENFDTPIVTTLFRNLGAFPVKRGTQDEKAYTKAKEIIRKGEFLGMFPEGTRSFDDTIGEFHTGSIRIAIELGVPVVPTCVIGTRNALPKGKLVMKPAQVIVRIGEPIYYDDHYGKELSYPTARKLSEELREAVINLLEGESQEKSKKEEVEVSIGSSTDTEKPSKLNTVKDYFNPKAFGKKMLQLIDDSWYGLLRSLQVFDLRKHFQEAIMMFSGNVVSRACDVLIPYKAIDFDKHIPKEGAALITPSHNSEWDVIMIATAVTQQPKRMLYQMSKQSLFKIPIVNAWVRNHHAFPLKRGGHDVPAYNYARELLEAEQLVCTYPEGTTNSGNGQLLEGHTGAIRLAIEAKVPIIPVGITGTERIYPKHAKMLNFGKSCVLKAGEPFMEHAKYWDAEEMPPYEVLKDLTNKLMNRIRGLLLYNIPDA